MIQREEEPQEQPKKIDYSKQMFELYETTIWCVNQLNRILLAFPDLQNWNPQSQPNPYQFLQNIQGYQQTSQSYQQQQNPYGYSPNIASAPVEEPVNPNVPTFSKRTVKPVQEEEKPEKKPWYKQKGIIFALFLGIIVLYAVWVMYMKSTGHTVTIPGLGKF